LPDKARRLKLIVAYDGSPFDGWQSQASGNAVQDHLEAALVKIAGAKVRLHGAGRTDAGVHALGQCAHVDLTTRLGTGTLHAALNASLPSAIRVLRCQFVARTFHARFSARGKIYRYRIATGLVLSPFEMGRAWHVSAPLDRMLLQKCGEEFLGTHHFGAFAANRGKPITSTIRTIRRVRVRRMGAITTIEFKGDGFLYKMVRLMVGAMVRCALARLSLEEVRRCLQEGSALDHRLVAPATGLTLLRVQY
jgi:tRNA pseudouridine38-40 synthase